MSNISPSQNIFPFVTDDNIEVSSPFGTRTDPITGEGSEHHNGIDFATPIGTDIHAIKAGTVFAVGYQKPDNPDFGFGLRLWIKHEDGTESFYAHMSFLEGFKVGSEIVPGQLVGQSGNSGRSSGPHFHYAERDILSGDWIDPTPTIENAQKFSSEELDFYFNHKVEKDENGDIVLDDNGNPKEKTATESLTEATNQDNGLTAEENAQNWFQTVGSTLSGWVDNTTGFISDAASSIGNVVSDAFGVVAGWVSGILNNNTSSTNQADADNSRFDLEVRTDQEFDFEQRQEDTGGNVIGDPDWEGKMNTINDDGLASTAPGGIVSDNLEPGAKRLADTTISYGIYRNAANIAQQQQGFLDRVGSAVGAYKIRLLNNYA
jgi:hypothetical protein